MSSRTLDITTAPFVSRGQSTPKIMREVLLALLPVIGAAIYFFGFSAILLILAATLGAVLTEWVFSRGRPGVGTLHDGTALLTGILLALTLPPSLPLWMAFMGGIISIGLGKLIWGGMGQNLFNPALVGRAFLQASFPIAITTWTPPGLGFFDLQPATLAAPFMRAGVDGITTATPLALAKFQDTMTGTSLLLLGNTGGSLGETSAVILIFCGLYLGFRRIFDWRLPVATLISVAVFSGLLYLINPGAYPDPSFMLLSGSMLFGTVFMVTDPVTTPITPKGAWIFGAGVGILVVLIRLFGGLPEGVMYSILLMNAVTPLINRKTQPRRFGG